MDLTVKIYANFTNSLMYENQVMDIQQIDRYTYCALVMYLYWKMTLSQKNNYMHTKWLIVAFKETIATVVLFCFYDFVIGKTKTKLQCN